MGAGGIGTKPSRRSLPQVLLCARPASLQPPAHRVTLPHRPLSRRMSSTPGSQQLRRGSPGSSLTNTSPGGLLSASALANRAEQQLKALPCVPQVCTLTLRLQQGEKGDLWETSGLKAMPCCRQADFTGRASHETVSET